MTTISSEVVPTGGIVKLYIESTDAGPWLLTRSTSSSGTLSNTVTLYSGAPSGLVLPPPALQSFPYFDIGDGTNAPLDQETEYQYTFSTAAGTFTTPLITPSGSISLEFNDYTLILFRALQAGIRSIVPPNGIAFRNKPSVTMAMPLTGQPTLPIISVNEDLIQQWKVPIGHGINADFTENAYVVNELVARRFSVGVLAMSQPERDFYKHAVLAIFKGILMPLLTEMGQDVSSQFQVAASQVTADLKSPGFYFADISLEFKGAFVTGITTNYGTVTGVDPDINGTLSTGLVQDLI